LKVPQTLNLNRQQWETLIDEWIIGKNSERNRNIVKRSLLDGATYERIAEEFEMSSRQVSRIVPKLLKTLFKSIE
jgi:DNA-directed RNA polymerase specialized sigma subunit